MTNFNRVFLYSHPGNFDITNHKHIQRHMTALQTILDTHNRQRITNK